MLDKPLIEPQAQFCNILWKCQPFYRRWIKKMHAACNISYSDSCSKLLWLDATHCDVSIWITCYNKLTAPIEYQRHGQFSHLVYSHSLIIVISTSSKHVSLAQNFFFLFQHFYTISYRSNRIHLIHSVSSFYDPFCCFPFHNHSCLSIQTMNYHSQYT